MLPAISKVQVQSKSFSMQILIQAIPIQFSNVDVTNTSKRLGAHNLLEVEESCLTRLLSDHAD